MKRLLIILFACLSLSVDAQYIDSTHFDYENPNVGDYITCRPVWGCSMRTIRPGAQKIIDLYLLPFIKQHPNYIFQIEEHTDCRASEDYNKELSQRISDMLRQYIITQGIDSNQIIAKGMGEDSLLVKKCKCDLSDNRNKCNEFEHQLNRRTILRIVGRKED